MTGHTEASVAAAVIVSARDECDSSRHVCQCRLCAVSSRCDVVERATRLRRWATHSALEFPQPHVVLVTSRRQQQPLAGGGSNPDRQSQVLAYSSHTCGYSGAGADRTQEPRSPE
jgi:hypothetical protein